MNLPAFIARRITFQSKRTFSTLSVRIAILGIMLSLSVMILSLAVMKGFKNEIREKVRGFSGDILLTKFDLNASQNNTVFSIPEDTLQLLRSMPEVSFIQPITNKAGIIHVNNEVEGVVLKGVDQSYHLDFFKKILVSGHVIDFRDSIKSVNEVLISRYTAKRLKLKTGDSFRMFFVQNPLRQRKLTICGIYDLGVEDVDKIYVVGSLALVQRLNNWEPGEVGGYEIRLTDFDSLDQSAYTIGDKINVLIKPVTIVDYYPSIFQWLSMLDVNTEVILVLMIAVAVINMISALLIIILERTAMIGILKSLGSSNWAIQKIFLYNAGWLIGIGLVLGNLLGIGLGMFQAHTHFFALDQESYYISFIPVLFDWTDILLLNAGTLSICLLAMLVPSRLVARISPIKAIGFK